MKKYQTKKIIAGVVSLGLIIVVAIVFINRFVQNRVFYYAGTLETTKVVLSARVASDVENVFVLEGDEVYSGQPLVELSCDAYKILARQINRDFDRATGLLERGHIADAEYDMLMRNKQDNDLKLQWCVIKSPIDGIVVNKFREVGEVVAPGMMVVSVANPYDIWAYFYVPYSMLYKLKVGQKVVGILPEAENMKFVGRIIKISEQAEFTPKNVQTRDERTRLVYGIKVQFENPNLVLKSGMVIESALGQDE
ncbi:MAG: efflux RND transporter periplasmic adaptor subunit [Alphaproteobacteria bacterium]|nr:efflux RND transporter periplasmic adaptor subunit [Alphaproteobacteria bacterium]